MLDGPITSTNGWSWFVTLHIEAIKISSQLNLLESIIQGLQIIASLEYVFGLGLFCILGEEVI